jgi:hypothetical protein
VALGRAEPGRGVDRHLRAAMTEAAWATARTRTRPGARFRRLARRFGKGHEKQTQFYDMTAQGQAIWVNGPARPKGPWMIWRWSGGAPVQITALPPPGASPYYGAGAIAW